MRAVKFLAVVVLGLAAVGQTTAPTTQPAAVNPVAAKLNTMPENLWPAAGETTARAQARTKWNVDAFPPNGAAVKITGKMVNVSEGGVPMIDSSGKPHIKPLEAVELDCGRADVWGSSLIVNVQAQVDIPSATALDWVKGQELTINGSVQSVEVYRGTLRVTLNTSSFVPPQPQKTTAVTNNHPSPPTTRPAYAYPTQP